MSVGVDNYLEVCINITKEEIMKRPFLPFLLFVTFITSLQAGWTRFYGGLDDDVAKCVQQTPDGGYIIAGWTFSFGAGAGDLWLLKLDANGDTMWTRTYGGEGDEAGFGGPCIQRTLDENYIVTGTTYSFTYDYDLWLLKFNADGDTLWTRTYGGLEAEEGYYIQQTLDGGYVIVGTKSSFSTEDLSDIWLLKTDAEGDTLWTRTYGGEDQDYGKCVQQTSDSGFIIVGHTWSFGDGNYADLWLLKTNAKGDTMWSRLYGGEKGDAGSSVKQTSDDGFIVCGSKGASKFDVDSLWLLRTDPGGDTLWTRTYEGGDGARGKCIQKTSDGGYIIAGVHDYAWPGKGDVWLLKIDEAGDTLWTRTYGLPGVGPEELAYNVQQTSDGGYILAGEARDPITWNYDVYVIKTNANGDTLAIDEELMTDGVAEWKLVSSIGSRIVLRYSERPDGFRVFIYDALGRKVDELHSTQTSGVITWGRGHSPGVYFFRVEGNTSHTTQKVVLIK